MMADATDLGRAVALLESGKADLALPIIGDYVASHPNDGDAVARLSQAFLFLGHNEQAEAAARDALLLWPENEFALRLLAHALIGRGAYREAVDAAEEAQRVAPEEWATHATRAEIDVRGRQETKAGHAAIATLLELAPDRAETHVAAAQYVTAKAGMYLFESEREIARRHFTTALTIEPQNSDAQTGLAKVELSTRYRTAKGARIMLDVIADDPANPRNRLGLFFAIYAITKFTPWMLLLTGALYGLAAVTEPAKAGSDDPSEFMRQLAAALTALTVFAWVFQPIRQLRGRALRLIAAVPRVSVVLTAWLAAIVLCVLNLLLAPFVPLIVSSIAVPVSLALVVITGLLAGFTRLALTNG